MQRQRQSIIMLYHAIFVVHYLMQLFYRKYGIGPTKVKDMTGIIITLTKTEFLVAIVMCTTGFT